MSGNTINKRTKILARLQLPQINRKRIFLSFTLRRSPHFNELFLVLIYSEIVQKAKNSLRNPESRDDLLENQNFFVY